MTLTFSNSSCTVSTLSCCIHIDNMLVIDAAAIAIKNEKVLRKIDDVCSKAIKL